MEGDEPLSWRPDRRTALLGLAAGLAAPARSLAEDGLPLRLDGRFMQGGVAVGRTIPGAQVLLDETPLTAASDGGWFVIGFDHDAPSRILLRVTDGHSEAVRPLVLQSGEYDVQRIDGLPQDTVTPMDPDLLARIRAEAERKQAGFASLAPRDDFKSGFIMPLSEFRLSGRFGDQRVLNGSPSRPHYGVDMAAPLGTPVLAPAAATVAFAETGLHYEGGLIMLDHGQGLVSAYLHLSQVLVAPGQEVAQGQPIAAVGAEGRATGPHLCWRMKWRDRNLNPLSLVGLRAA